YRIVWRPDLGGKPIVARCHFSACFTANETAPVMNSRQDVIHVVDDDASFRKAMYRLLHASGYGVVLHESGAQALENISNDDRGCILLDVQMSGLNGIELQERLEKVGNALPIVFISGHGDIPTSVRVIKFLIKGFLTRPVSKAFLLPFL